MSKSQSNRPILDFLEISLPGEMSSVLQGREGGRKRKKAQNVKPDHNFVFFEGLSARPCIFLNIPVQARHYFGNTNENEVYKF